MSENQNRTLHEELIAAGWIYDQAQNRYAAPGSPLDGAARMYNLDAAWLAHSTGTAPLPPKTQPKANRASDPRHKEPE